MKPPRCGCTDADGEGATTAVGLAVGDADDGPAEVTADEVGLWAGVDVGAGDIESGCVTERLGGELEAAGSAGVEATEAALLPVHALPAASTVAAASATLRPRRPRPWLATSRG